MNQEEKDRVYEKFFDLLTKHKVFYLVGKRRLADISEVTRSYASYANRELLDAIGMPVEKARGEIFIFNSEKAFFIGAHHLKQREGWGGYEVTSVSSSPQLLLDKVLQLKPKVIHLDFGSAEAQPVGPELFDDVQLLPALFKFSEKPKVFVLEHKTGVAIEVPLDEEGKRYAVAFSAAELSTEMVRTLQQESPGARVVANDTRTMVNGLVSSELHGLVINPGDQSEMVLNRDGLKLLCAALSYRQQSSSLVNRAIRSLFRRPEQ